MNFRTAVWIALITAPVIALACFVVAVWLIDAPPPWSDIGATFFFLVGLFTLGGFAMCVKYLVEHRRRRSRRSPW